MGYYEAMARRGQKIESEQLSKAGAKKSLWGSVGRTLGGLGAMALTGGMVNPLTVGLLSGAASFAGGAIGASTLGGGKLGKKGGWFEKEGKAAQKELGAFGTQNLMSSLKSGLTAGMGQATKLYKAGSEAERAGSTAEEVAKIRKGVGFKEGFGESFAGKGWDKYVTQPKAVKAAGEQAKLTEHLGVMDEFAAEFGEGGGSKRGLEKMAVSRPDPYYSGDQPTLQDIREYGTTPTESISAFTQKMPSDPSFEFGEGGGKSDPFKRDISWGDALYDYRELFEKIGLKSGMSTVIGGK